MFKGLRTLVSVAVFCLVLGGSPSRPFGAAAPAEAVVNCTLSLTTFTGSSLTGWLGGVKKFTGSYLGFTTQLKVQVSPNNCVWRIDRSRADTASWLTTKLVTGKRRDDGAYVGPATLDLNAARNGGKVRETAIYFAISGSSTIYDAARFSQSSVSDYCQPLPTAAGTTLGSTPEPGFLVLTEYGQPSGTPPALVQYRFRDAAGCATMGGIASTTPNLASAKTRLYLETPATGFLFLHPGVTLKQAGGAVLAHLGDVQSFWQARSAVFVRYLLRPELLPADLRISSQTLTPSLVAVSDGGGVVEVAGHVVRSTSSASRPCLFKPTYFHVVEEDRPGTGTQWLKVGTTSGCETGKPDDGKLVVSVAPSAPSVTRIGALYTDWGAAILVVQR